jgi:hypothetical protein
VTRLGGAAHQLFASHGGFRWFVDALIQRSYPRGDHGSSVALVHNSGARYLFGGAHNQTQRVRKNESKTWSEKDYTFRVADPLSTAWWCPASRRWYIELSVPFLIAVAIPDD